MSAECFTQNTDDFAAIHGRWSNAGKAHSGIILLTDQRTPPGVQIRAVASINALYEDPSGFLFFLLNFA